MNYFRPHLEKHPLPEGWSQVPMKHFISGMTSGSRPSGGSESDANGVFSLGGEHIDDHGGLRFDNMTYVPRPFFESIREDALVQVNDTLLNKDGAKTGKVAFVDDTFPFAEACINEHVFRIRADRSIVQDRNLFYFLLSSVGQAQLSKYIQGSAQPGINQRFPKFLLIRVPTDPDGQTRIAKTLKSADDHIRALEEQILKAERVAVALDQSHFAASPHDVKFPYEYGTARTIPNRWAPKPLGKIADVTSGITLNQDREAGDNGVRYLTVINVHRGRIDLTEVRHLELRGNEAETKRIAADDVMVIEGHANTAEIGRAALATEHEQGMSFQNHLFRVRVFDKDEMRPRFLVRALNSTRVRRYWAATANTSSGLNTINRTALRRLILPVPKHTEQDTIIERLEAAEDLVTSLKKQLIAARRVKQSLLQNLVTGKIRLKG
jgi:type I restriction enzyme S subunit